MRGADRLPEGFAHRGGRVAPPRDRIVASRDAEYAGNMKTMPYVYWQHEDAWIGYLQEFPDYWTQGESRDELEENLKDLWQDLTSGAIPEVRRVAELQVS